MKHIESFEYNGRKVDIYEAERQDLENLRVATPVYRVNVDGECVSENHSMPGPTLDLLRGQLREWIDNNPQDFSS